MDGLTPVQQRTLDDLMGRAAPRPVFDPALSMRLRAAVLDAVGDVGPQLGLRLSKHALNDHHRCEGLYAARLAGEMPAFAHGVASAAGALAHKAVELDVPRQRRDPSPPLVERAAERLVEADASFAAYWSGLDGLERAELLSEGVRLLEQFRATFPPLQMGWTPVTELPVRVEIGPVSVSGRVDLVLGAADAAEPMRARRLVLDLKTGRAWPEFPEDMRLYALLLTLRFGVPPFRVASVFLESGEWQLEDVSEQTLFHAAERLARAARAAAELRADRAPELRPGRHCGWCPRRAGCPAAPRDPVSA